MEKLTDAEKLMDADIYFNLYRLPSLPSQSTTVQCLQKKQKTYYNIMYKIHYATSLL